MNRSRAQRWKRLVSLVGLALLAVAACATSRPFEPLPERCTTATDCEITGFRGCCDCDVEPEAVNRQSLAERTEICAVVYCQCKTSRCTCPDVTSPSAFEAACVNGLCEAVRRGPK